MHKPHVHEPCVGWNPRLIHMRCVQTATHWLIHPEFLADLFFSPGSWTCPSSECHGGGQGAMAASVATFPYHSSSGCTLCWKLWPDIPAWLQVCFMIPLGWAHWSARSIRELSDHSDHSETGGLTVFWLGDSETAAMAGEPGEANGSPSGVGSVAQASQRHPGSLQADTVPPSGHH